VQLALQPPRAFSASAVTRRRRKQLAGKVVRITGSSRGFGLALAREFASLKCRLALCERDRDELERARRKLALAGREVFTVVCDFSDRNAIKDMVGLVTRHYGRIDILVNNVGEIMVSSFENLDVGDFERAMAVMFWGTPIRRSRCCD